MKFSGSVRAVAVVVAGLLAGSFVLNLVPLILLDGATTGLLLAPFTDTEYAPHYSHVRFLKLRVGMTRAEVVELVGEPLSKSAATGSVEYWRYSRSPGDTHYRVRSVLFDPTGLVLEIHNEFYVD